MTKTTKCGNSYQRRKQSKKKDRKEKVFKFFNSFLMFLVVVMISYYVSTVNDITIKGLKIQELKQEVGETQEQNRDLTVQASSLKSYKSLVKRTENLNMTRAEEVEYIKVLRQTVAKK